MSKTTDTDLQRSLLTVSEVADRLRISPSSAYELIAAGKLVCYRIGGRRGTIRVSAADLEEYLNSCRVETHAPKPRLPRTDLKHIRT